MQWCTNAAADQVPVFCTVDISKTRWVRHVWLTHMRIQFRLAPGLPERDYCASRGVSALSSCNTILILTSSFLVAYVLSSLISQFSLYYCRMDTLYIPHRITDLSFTLQHVLTWSCLLHTKVKYSITQTLPWENITGDVGTSSLFST